MTTDLRTKNILTVYTVLMGSVICGFIPNVISAVLALILFSAALSMAGSRRKKADGDGDIFTSGHMTYVIVTLWVSCLVVFISTIIGSVYVLRFYDPVPLHACLDSMMAGAITPELEGCIRNFTHVNWAVFLRGTIIAATPLILYLGFRIARGLSAVLKNRIIEKPGSWL